MTRSKIILSLFALSLAGFAAIQCVRPALKNPPVLADLKAPPEVKKVLQNSCYDCHSNETKLLWFDQIQPGYSLVVRDVKHGRVHMNFSDFDKMPGPQQAAFLFESVNQIQAGAMPPAKYTLLHRNAVVTPGDLEVLRNYLKTKYEIGSAPSTAQATAAADDQYNKWLISQAPSSITPELNGIPFPADYKNWKTLSTTDRLDNGTLRVILGNDIAIKAVKDGQINPWPDGTMFAKIAWIQQVNADGSVTAGEFKQVEFMIKDKAKYASTKGWGFGRWLGTDLKPYGKNAQLAESCVSCHKPLEKNDFVFTMPITNQPVPLSDLINKEASLPSNLPQDPLQWKVITSSLNNPQSTMSTLYGNDVAVQYARTNSQHAYPAGSVLCLVTWTRKEDKHWFGGEIPAQIKSVEYVNVNASSSVSYELYEGTPLVKMPDQENIPTALSVKSIVEMRASVMP